MKKKLFYLLFFVSISCSSEEMRTPVSIISLIGAPDKFDGKIVRVLGYGVFNDHNTLICLNKNDIDYGLSKNCLWVGLESQAVDGAEKLSDSYVDLEGVFVKNKEGYMSTASGIIKKVKSVYPSMPVEK